MILLTGRIQIFYNHLWMQLEENFFLSTKPNFPGSDMKDMKILLKISLMDE